MLSGALDASNPPELRNAAADALGFIGPTAKGVLPKLIDLFEGNGLDDPHRPSPDTLVFALARIAPNDERVTKLLLPTLGSQPGARSPKGIAIRMICQMGPKAQAEAIRVLDRLSKAQDHEPKNDFDAARKIRHCLRADR